MPCCFQRRPAPTPVFSQVFQDFIDHRCAIKPSAYTPYPLFMTELKRHFQKKYKSQLALDRPSFVHFIETKYPDVFVYDDFIFGIRLWM